MCARRVDDNQKEIVQAARQMGASVLPIHELGKGAPDLLIGWRGKNYLVEAKDGNKSPSRRKLTEDEEFFHTTWRGQVVIINSVSEIISFLNGRQ
jgi:hypothetical protein